MTQLARGNGVLLRQNHAPAHDQSAKSGTIGWTGKDGSDHGSQDIILCQQSEWAAMVSHDPDLELWCTVSFVGGQMVAVSPRHEGPAFCVVGT